MKISVIIPVHNVKPYIKDCIDSVICQDHKNIEIILVDDGSTDGSAEICSDYLNKDSRIMVFHKNNGGVSSARNLGLREATGDYVGFIDSDDWIEPEMYECLLESIVLKDAQMCANTKYKRGLSVYENANIKDGILSRTASLINLLKYNFPTSLWSCLYKKDLVKNEYLNEEIHHLEDFEFQMRILSKIDRVAICSKPYYNYRSREGSANGSGFNDKVLSCLNVLPTVEKIINENANLPFKYIDATRSRLILTVSAFMAKAKYTNEELERQIVTSARQSLFNTLISGVPYKKKILIMILSLSYRTYSILYRRYKLSIQPNDS